jgi:UDP-N-acetyl-D-mannosaminuronate dehydrogenase
MQFYSGSNVTVADGSSSSDGRTDGAYIATTSSRIKKPSKYPSKNANSKSNISRSLGIPMHPVSKVEIAELSKITENAHRYLQIAFAEDLYLYCQANNINFSELRDALNTKWNVNILEPREGIGGHCLPKDTKMFLQSSKSIRSKILSSAIEVDQDYRQYMQNPQNKVLPSQVEIKKLEST